MMTVAMTSGVGAGVTAAPVQGMYRAQSVPDRNAGTQNVGTQVIQLIQTVLAADPMVGANLNVTA